MILWFLQERGECHEANTVQQEAALAVDSEIYFGFSDFQHRAGCRDVGWHVHSSKGKRVRDAADGRHK